MADSFLFVDQFCVMLQSLRKYIGTINPDKLNVENWENLIKLSQVNSKNRSSNSKRSNFLLFTSSLE